VVPRIKQPVEYIIRRLPLSIESSLISTLITCQKFLIPWRLAYSEDRWNIHGGVPAFVVFGSDGKPLFAEFGLC
jgi:hypothetical protein